MKRLSFHQLLLLLLLATIGVGACRAANLQLGRYELLDYQPAPNPATVVVSADGMAAFTVLSERLIRMEYTATANVFETRPSVAFVNRYVAQALAVNVSSTAKSLTLETSALRVTYRLGAAFNADNLLVEGLRPGQGFTRWTPAMSNSNSGNLLGTVRSLDLAGVLPLNCTENADIMVHHESLHCAWGLMGRQGFALVDDTASWMLSPEDYFWDGPNADAQDWYLFAHGQDYKGALQDFVGVAGRVAMPPRYAAGIMYTRWYNYDSLSLKHILNAFESRDLPLDVLILDMDWHEKSGWGAYSTDQRLFQYPADAYGWVRSQGVALALNLHDNNGVVYTENMYQAFADSLGFDTSQKATVPFSIVNSTWVFNLEDIVLGDLVDMGVNFWWIDWQQGGVAGGIPASSGQSQNPTIMLNHIRATDNMRRGSPERAMVLGRWGGLGNHRYQVGFSGDVLGPRSLPEFGLSWRNLAYQPYFTWTASNVGFGFWSHDLVGPRYDHELHTRWLQWGANSGVFRTHDRGMSSGYCAEVDEELCAVVRPWNVPLRFYEINRDCMRRRAEWLPYIYQQYRVAYDTGVSIVRPMYYESPDLPMAYAGDPTGAFSQYYFGEAMIVAPVVQHSSEGTQMATKSVWLPPGQWFELSTGLLFSGGPSAVLTKNYDLSEIPTFIRAGAVIPSLVLDASASSLGAASRQYQHLRFSIYPGSDTGSFSLYEDDGATTAYVSPTATASTTVAYAYKRSNASSQLLITISTQGGYPELPSSRPYQVALPNVFPPSGVLLNGVSALSYARFPRAATSLSTGFWTYLGNEVSLLIQLPSLPISQPLQLAVEWNGAPDQASLGGLIGMLHHGMLAKENLDEVGVTPGTHTTAGGYLDLLVSSGDALTYLAGVNATQFHSHVGALTSTVFPRAVAEVNALHTYLEGSLLQLYSESRQDSLLCASAKCVNDNIRYYQIRIEAYLPSSTDGSAPLVPLHVYWNPATQDHLATTLPPPSGFERTGIPSASVLPSPANGTVPLSLWYHPIRRDHLTVASPAGLDFARMWGYSLVNASIGYVLPQPPVSQAVPREYVPHSRLAYSLALLLSVFTTPTIG